MKVSFPIAINDDLTGTLSLSIKIGKEMSVQSMKSGLDPDDLEELMAQKLSEVTAVVASALGVSYNYDEV